MIDEFVPVADAEGDGAGVDEVELLREDPFLGGVIDYETAVWGHFGGLDGGEIGSEDGGGGVGFGEFDGPCWMEV